MPISDQFPPATLHARDACHVCDAYRRELPFLRDRYFAGYLAGLAHAHTLDASRCAGVILTCVDQLAQTRRARALRTDPAG